jgi:hypoxanthine phosphoribosyltransferase
LELADLPENKPAASSQAKALVLVSRERIAERVAQLAGEISNFYAGREVTVVMVLTGALVFVADLVRQMNLAVRIEPVSVSSYPGEAVRSEACHFRLPPPESLAGRDVLIVDDIYDSGQTLAFLEQAILATNPASLRCCMLLQKDRPDLARRPGQVHWVGFTIPDEFVVGYGLDYNDLHRNGPDITQLPRVARGEDA